MKYNSSTFSTNVCKWWIFYSVTSKNWETARVLSSVQLPTSSASPRGCRQKTMDRAWSWVDPGEQATEDSELRELGSF